MFSIATHVFSSFFWCFASVSDVSCKCFSCFGRMLQIFHLDITKVDQAFHMLQCTWEAEETRAVSTHGLATWATSGRRWRGCAGWSMSMECRCTQSVTRASGREHGRPGSGTDLRLTWSFGLHCNRSSAWDWDMWAHGTLVIPDSQTHHGNYLVH
jgi:hypothetical protein